MKYFILLLSLLVFASCEDESVPLVVESPKELTTLEVLQEQDSSCYTIYVSEDGGKLLVLKNNVVYMKAYSEGVVNRPFNGMVIAICIIAGLLIILILTVIFY